MIEYKIKTITNFNSFKVQILCRKNNHDCWNTNISDWVLLIENTTVEKLLIDFENYLIDNNYGIISINKILSKFKKEFNYDGTK